MPEHVEKYFVFPNFPISMPGTLRGVLDNYIEPRNKISLNGLGMTKVKTGGLSMILKTGLEAVQYYNVFNHVPQIPQKDLKSQVKTILAQPGMNPAPNLFIRAQQKENWEGTSPRYVDHV